MKVIKFKDAPYIIRVSDEGYPSLCTADGSEWTKADDASCDIIMLEEIIKMRKLLHQADDAVGLVQMMDADEAITQYIESLPK